MTTDTVGGVWTYALELARGLAAHGVRTRLVSLGPVPDAGQITDAEAVPGLALRVTALPLDWLAANSGEVLAAGREIAAIARTARADVIHLNSPALAAAGSFHAPVLGACHSCLATWWAAVRGGPMPPDFAWRTDLLRRGYANATALVAPSHAFARATAEAYALPVMPAAIHNGRALAPRLTATPPDAPDFVFTAGRLWDPGKNLVTLDRAAARLSLPVLAAGPLRGPEGSKAAPRHVTALGQLDAQDMATRLQARPIYVALARYEPFGLAVLEAAQAGCPLVLSDIPTFRELWADAALFVPSEDDAAAAATITALLADKPMRVRLGLAAQRHALRYTPGAMAGAMHDLYLSLLGRRGRVEAAA
ncbi:MAG TPA: glycosyltransferase family 4 protein [Roseomonas sp.]|jgi:glycosyltransferase involved in cell wall biosynthesis